MIRIGTKVGDGFKERYIVKELLEAVKDRKCDKVIALTGQRRVGKTTALKMLCNRLEDAAMFTCDRDDDMESVILYLREIPESVVVLDEITEIPDFYRLSNMLYDSSRDKKIIITGTDSLIINKAIDNHFVDRVKDIKMYPMSLLESKDVVGISSIEDYLRTGGYFREIGVEDEIDFIVSSLCNTYIKITGYAEDYTTVKGIIQLLMFNVVWRDITNNKHMLRILGAPKSDEETIKKSLVEELVCAGFFDRAYNMEDISRVYKDMIKAGLVVRCSGVKDRLSDKIIFMNLKFKTYMYDRIFDITGSLNIAIESGVYRGIIFENICNYAVSTLGSKYTQKSLEQEIFGLEVDEVLLHNDQCFIVDYKAGEKVHRNKFIDNKNKLKAILGKSVKDLRTAYVYAGITEGSCINVYDFLRSVKAGTLDKLIK